MDVIRYDVKLISRTSIVPIVAHDGRASAIYVCSLPPTTTHTHTLVTEHFRLVSPAANGAHTLTLHASHFLYIAVVKFVYGEPHELRRSTHDRHRRRTP